MPQNRILIHAARAARSAFLVLTGFAVIPAASMAANRYNVHNLVSDIAGMADQTDPKLVNPWGIAVSPASPFWISDNHSGFSTVYDGAGKAAPAANPLVVNVPPASGTAPPQSGGAPAGSPTGIVFNDTAGFKVSGQPAAFLFVSEDGVISGWSAAADRANAVVLLDNSGSGAVYKGMAVAVSANGPRLYAANFHSGSVDVFDENLAPVTLMGGFADPYVPDGFAPFNIQKIGRKLYVTYAKQDADKHDDSAGPGMGFVNVFDFDGYLIGHLIYGDKMNSPWGLALAPSNFGDFSNALLVGNFGDGTVNAFDPCSGEYLGTLQDSSGANIVIPGLWALLFGNGRGGGDANTLYFTAGAPGPGNLEDHGLFGAIQTAAAAPAPQPASLRISNFAFAPPTISIAAGTAVQWTNQDGAAHTVTADDGGFASGNLDGGGVFTQTFMAPGDYSYHCAIHPFMKGKVTVQ